MLSKQQKIRIKQLLNQEISQGQIAKRVHTTRHQVRKILEEIKNGSEAKEGKTNKSHALENYRDQIVRWIEEKQMSAFLIHKKLTEQKFICSYSSVQRFVRSLKKREVYVPVITKPGEEAQVDYGYLGRFEKNGKEIKVWVFNMVLSYSRYAFYTIATEQTIGSFIKCHRQAFEAFGGVPASVKIDNLGAGVIEADFYEPYFQESYADFLAHYGTTAVTARICRGQDKGKVESGIKYVKSSFLRRLKHKHFEKLETDLKKWVKYECNLRLHGTTRKSPNDEYIKVEKSQLIALPDEPYTINEREERKVDEYGHIYFQYCFYSVPHHYAGEMVIVESNGSIIRILKGVKEIAIHPINKKKGIFVTLDAHKPFYKQLKTDLFYQEEMEKIGLAAVRIMELMRLEKPFHWKNMTKGIITLSRFYSSTVMNKACEVAIKAGSHNFKYIKQVCEKKLYEEERPVSMFPKDVGGYYHDLSLYDQLVEESEKEIK